MFRFLTILAILLFAAPATADSTQLWLARYCVNEAGWQRYTRHEDGTVTLKPWEETSHRFDCPAMARSMINNFEQPELKTWMMRRYGGNVFNRVDRTNRPYIPFLRPVPQRPRRWNRASWPDHYPRFVEIYELAGDILSGEVSAPEECQPHHWGAPSLRWRSRRRGWAKQECGPTVNDFWRVPRRTFNG